MHITSIDRNMASKKILVVFGATGSQGGSVVTSILNDSKAAEQFHIRAVTRDPTKPNAKKLADQGAELISVRSGISLCLLSPICKLLKSDRALESGRLRKQRLPPQSFTWGICRLRRDKLLGEDGREA